MQIDRNLYSHTRTNEGDETEKINKTLLNIWLLFSY